MYYFAHKTLRILREEAMCVILHPQPSFLYLEHNKNNKCLLKVVELTFLHKCNIDNRSNIIQYKTVSFPHA